MADGQAYRQFAEIAQKWRRLAERRCEQFAEIYRSGRWKCYCAEEEEFALRMREVLNIAYQWRQIAPPSADNSAQSDTPSEKLQRNAA